MAQQVALRRQQDLEEKMGRIPMSDEELSSCRSPPVSRPSEGPSYAMVPLNSALILAGAGGIKQEDQSRAESAMKRLVEVFGTTPQSCMTAYMALLKCVAFNLQDAYTKMLEGISGPTEQPTLSYFGAQTNVRTLGLPLRAPVPTTSPTYAPAFPPTFLTSSASTPLFYPSYNWSNCAGYWGSPYSLSSAAGAAPAPAVNGAAGHHEGPLYPLVAPPHPRLTDVASSGDSRGSAEYRDEGSDKEGGPSRSSPPRHKQQQQQQPRFHPYERSTGGGSSKKRDFEETVSIREDALAQ